MHAAGESPSKHSNRLIHETSPYLLQHAHNPVEWYAWGREAFEAARSQDKPIFLSVGYSTCYWCHVMERESFENPTVAAEMNRLFINIKVDREERPDVDQLYMTAVQVLTQHGGWPMSVFLSPDLRPFYGGTYFPPMDQNGRPGFVTLLRGIADAYKNRRTDVNKTAGELVNILAQIAEPTSPTAPITIDSDWIDALVGRSTTDYDRAQGGFGSAPKFPRQTLLELLLRYTETGEGRRQTATLNMVLHTLDAMAAGGIRDQLGGAFHRYSTDAQWLVPHFEIMLYDNAMLGWCYVEAYRRTGEPRYARIARGIFDFVLREMTSPQGAFYTAFDAEVDAREGASYLWTAEEIESILGSADATIFNAAYGVDQGPNFADPHHNAGQPDASILFQPEPLDEAADATLAPMRQKLYQVRLKRKQPLLDTKIITSWNALMIRALAFGGKVLAEPIYVQAALRASEFLLQQHRLPDGAICRTSRDGVAKLNGFLDDYAFLVQALLAVEEASGQKRWREMASSLARLMQDRFASSDPSRGGFYFTDKSADDLVVRQKVASDSPLPSGNAVAAMSLLSLGQIDAARATIAAFAQSLEGMAEGMSSMLQAAMLCVGEHGAFTASGIAESNPQDRPLTPQQVAAGVVTLRAEWVEAQELKLNLSILKGFHINAHKAGKGLIPTELSVDSDLLEAIDYPSGEEETFAFATASIRVYSGDVMIGIRFKQPPPAGTTLRLTLSYQACDDEACFPPVTKHLDVAVP